MAPHLSGARSVYKDRRIRSEGKRWVFSFDLKEESEDECQTERGREFQITGPMYLKDKTEVISTIFGFVSVR